MFNRKDIAEELLLRENVRKAVRHVIKRRRESILKEEKQLRSIISSLITESDRDWETLFVFLLF